MEEFDSLEWDEQKRLSNIKKHDLDFLDAVYVLRGPWISFPTKTVNGEVRKVALGMLDDLCVAIIYTERGAALRLISMRKQEMLKVGAMTKFSVAELERIASGESRTDMARLRRMTEVELEEKVSGDPDWEDIPRDWHLQTDAILHASKKLVSLRIDNDVLNWFRQQGPGYQTRINAVLRAFVEHSSKKRAG